MNLKIFSKPFFTNYIVHPRSDDLSKHDKKKAVISSIAIGILTLGICHAFCAIKFHNKRLTMIDNMSVAQLQKDRSIDPAELLKQALNTRRSQEERLLLLVTLDTRNYAPAQVELGRLFYDGGEGIAQDKEAGLKFFRKAADAGDVEACHELCLALASGRPLTDAAKEEIRQRAQVCFDNEDPIAIEFDPNPEILEKVIVRNQEELEDFFAQVESEQANPNSFNDTNMYTNAELHKIARELPYEQMGKKLEYLRILVAKDFAPALHSLGLLYLTDKDEYHAQGMNYLRRAADQGHIDACKELCLRLSQDSPVQKDVIREKAQVVFNANHLVRIWDPHRHGSPKVKNMEELEHYLENL